MLPFHRAAGSRNVCKVPYGSCHVRDYSKGDLLCSVRLKLLSVLQSSVLVNALAEEVRGLQVFFGMCGDYLGRKKIYLLTLLIIITATIGQAMASSTVMGAHRAHLPGSVVRARSYPVLQKVQKYDLSSLQYLQ